MVRSNKIVLCLILCMLFVMSGCYTYTEFSHPKKNSNGEPLELGDIYMENGCTECHQQAFSSSTTILPDGAMGRNDWEFYYLNAWWEESYDLPPIRTQYIDIDTSDPTMIGGSARRGMVPMNPDEYLGPGPLPRTPIPTTQGPVFIPTATGKVDIPDPKSSSDDDGDARRTEQRRDKQTVTPAPRTTSRRTDSSNSDRSTSSSTSSTSNSSGSSSSTGSSSRQTGSGGSRSSDRRR